MTTKKYNMYVVFSALLSLGAAATAAPVVRNQKEELLFNITLLNKSLEEQAIVELARAAEEANSKINAHLNDFCTLKEVPTKTDVFVDEACDWFFQSNFNNKAARYASIVARFIFTGIIPGTGFGIWKVVSASNKKKLTEPLTFQDKLSRSLFALSSLAVQTYIMERTGVDKVATLTIGDVIEIIKEKARQGNSDISHDKAKEMAQALMRNIQTSFSKDKVTPEIPAEAQKMITELEEKSALLGQQLEELARRMAELEELKK